MDDELPKQNNAGEREAGENPQVERPQSPSEARQEVIDSFIQETNGWIERAEDTIADADSGLDTLQKLSGIRKLLGRLNPKQTDELKHDQYIQQKESVQTELQNKKALLERVESGDVTDIVSRIIDRLNARITYEENTPSLGNGRDSKIIADLGKLALFDSDKANDFQKRNDAVRAKLQRQLGMSGSNKPGTRSDMGGNLQNDVVDVVTKSLPDLFR